MDVHTTGRHDGALRRRVVETALALFRTRGIKAVTMDDIAHALTISKRTLYLLSGGQIFTVNQGNETEQTIALGRNENGEHFLCRLPESEKQGFPVLLICENGKNMKTRTTLFPQGKEGLSFQWAKEALPAIHAALLKTLRSAEGEKLFELFQKQEKDSHLT